MSKLSIRWWLEFLLEMIDSALKHLRGGPERAAALSQRAKVEGALASLDAEDAAKRDAAKAKSPKADAEPTA